MSGALATISPIHAETVLPLGDDGKEAVQVGTVKGWGGKTVPLYERTIIRAAKEKAPEIDPVTGEQKWELHPTTAQPLYPRWKNRREERKQRFTLESDGHANLYIREYFPPTAEEIKRQETEAKAAAFKDDLARLAAERGIDAESLLARLMESQGAEEPGASYPQMVSPGRWVLSNGQKFQGKKAEAEAAEAALTDDQIPPA